LINLKPEILEALITELEDTKTDPSHRAFYTTRLYFLARFTVSNHQHQYPTYRNTQERKQRPNMFNTNIKTSKKMQQ